MPKIVDEEERRLSITDAALSIIARDGLENATFRAIAQERGLSLGAIQHSFSDQAQLRQCVVGRFIQKVTDRLEALDVRLAQHAQSRSHLEAASILLFELLPLNKEREAEARIWESFSHASLTDAQIAPLFQQLDGALNAFCVGLIAQLKENFAIKEELDDSLEGTRLQALLDGLTLSLLIEPSNKNRSIAQSIILRHLESLRSDDKLPGRSSSEKLASDMLDQRRG